MKVREILSRKSLSLVTVPPESLVGTVIDLLLRHNIGAVPVVSREGKLMGIFGERDVLRGLRQHGSPLTQMEVRQVMQRDLPTCETDSSVLELMNRMTRDRLRHVMVLEEGRLVGIVSVGDLVKNRLDQLETEANILRDYVIAARARS